MDDQELNASLARSADHAAREIAQTFFEAPLVLEAGAGTGKTSALVSRVVAWCLGEGWVRADQRVRASRPSAGEDAHRERVAADVLRGVVAITFTEAAAAEMAQRVGRFFQEVSAGVRPEALLVAGVSEIDEMSRKRAAALLSSLDHLVVRTIHAWCRRLLARFPVEAGLHPGFQIDADARAQSEIAREVVEGQLEKAYSEGSESPLLALAAEGFGPPQVERALAALIAAGVTEQDFDRDPVSADRIRALLGEMQRALSSLLDQAGDRMSGVRGVTSDLLATARLSQTQIDALAAAESFPLCDVDERLEEVRDAWADNVRSRLRDWANGKFNKGEGNAAGDAADAIASAAQAQTRMLRRLHNLRPHRLDLARRALLPLLVSAREIQRARGVVGYADLLRGARDLLRDHASVRDQIRRDLDQLLVDEFQDTDALQCELVHLLALRGPTDERPGLFLVGDPKQSIYGWRNADLRAYDGFVEEVLSAGGRRERLCVNFRSVPAVLDEVERVVDPVMWREVGLQPSFQPLFACEANREEAGFSRGGRAAVEYWVSWPREAADEVPRPDAKAKQIARFEARAIARDLRDLHDREGVDWSESAILFRSGSDLDEYLSALREHGVPYVVERDRSYFRRREIIDAAALVRCVLDPNDHLALLTWLRSPSVGVPDVALRPLWERELPKQAGNLRGEDSSVLNALAGVVREVASKVAGIDGVPGLERVRGWEESLVGGLETLGALRRSFASEDGERFVERVRTFSLVEVTEAARYLGGFRAANLDRFFRELRDALVDGVDPQVVLRGLRGDIASAREAEEETPPSMAENAVRVMTIHKAKGLDFAHVYVVQLHKGSPRSVSVDPEVICAGDECVEYLIAGAATPGLAAYHERSEAVSAAERVRTLYVAMTRAEKRLVMVGQWPEDPLEAASQGCDPDAVRKASSYTGLLVHRRPEPPALAEWADQVASRGDVLHRDDDGVLWRFEVERPTPPAARGERRAELPGAERARQESLAVAERGDRARGHMDRPIRAAASYDAHAEQRERVAQRRFGDSDTESSTAAQLQIALVRAPRGTEREVAMAAGTVLHRVLEEIDLESEPDLAAERARAAGWIAAMTPGPLVEAISLRVDHDLERMLSLGVIERLRGLRPSIVARELPVLVGPGAGGDPEHPDLEPVGFVAGAIDLVYRDPDTQRLVVVDYKTDHVESSEAARSRAQRYTEQGRAYVRALGEALGLPETEQPRCELWFVTSGDIVPIEPSS